MRIIKHGRTGIQFDCDCGCCFEATQHEYNECSVYDYKREFTCKCPECGRLVDHIELLPIPHHGEIGF